MESKFPPWSSFTARHFESLLTSCKKRESRRGGGFIVFFWGGGSTAAIIYLLVAVGVAWQWAIPLSMQAFEEIVSPGSCVRQWHVAQATQPLKEEIAELKAQAASQSTLPPGALYSPAKTMRLLVHTLPQPHPPATSHRQTTNKSPIADRGIPEEEEGQEVQRQGDAKCKATKAPREEERTRFVASSTN